MIHRYITDHWKGDLGFGPTLFINLIGLGLLIGALTFEVLPDWAVLIAGGVLASIFLWQVIGGWRCATRILKEHPGNNQAWGVYLGIAAAIGLTGFQILDIVANRFFIEPKAKTIFGNDDFTAHFKKDTVYLTGEINYLMYQALLTILSQQDSVKTISLDSHGGIVYAARSIAQMIEDRGITTVVDRECYSACTLVFAAGETRILAPKAEMGFHGYSYDIPYRFQTVDPIEAQKKDQAYLAARGIDPDFLERAFATDAKTLWKPARVELFNVGFITEP